MEDKQDKWEKLNHLTEEYEPDPDLAYRVLEKINQRESTVTFKSSKKTIAGVITLVVFLVIAVFLCLQFIPSSRQTGLTLYTAEDIGFNNISDMQGFCDENDYQIKFYSGTAYSQFAYLRENNTIAYIMQDVDMIGESDFDKLNLKVVVLENSEFEFCENFKYLDNSISVSNITVEYSNVLVNSKIIYLAKFNFENYDYFIELTTYDEGIQVLEKYIELLIS